MNVESVEWKTGVLLLSLAVFDMMVALGSKSQHVE